jgi:hypothetical protein
VLIQPLPALPEGEEEFKASSFGGGLEGVVFRNKFNYNDTVIINFF